MNFSFSQQLPGLQLGVDSTSLGEFKQCPQKYYRVIIQGWQTRSEQTDLVFGIHMHRAAETYGRLRAQGKDHQYSLEYTVTEALLRTWNRDLKRPWISDHKTKNRISLLRAIVWYFDQFQEDTLQTVILASGKAAVEQHFVVDSGYVARSTGERIMLTGWLGDRLAKLGDDTYVVDMKTTEHQLDARFFSGFSPDNQFSLYVFAGQLVYGQRVKGLIVDGLQVGVTFARAERQVIPRSEAQIEEWHRDLGYWLSQMDQCATSGIWPMNDKACGMYRGCQFRGVCSKSPASRDATLRAEFIQRQWDPLSGRRD